MLRYLPKIALVRKVLVKRENLSWFSISTQALAGGAYLMGLVSSIVIVVLIIRQVVNGNSSSSRSNCCVFGIIGKLFENAREWCLSVMKVFRKFTDFHKL